VALTPRAGEIPHSGNHTTYNSFRLTTIEASDAAITTFTVQFKQTFSSGLRLSGVVPPIPKFDRHRLLRWYGVEGQSGVQDPYHYNNDRSVSGFDLTHGLVWNLCMSCDWKRQALLHRGKWVGGRLHLGGMACGTRSPVPASGQRTILRVSGDSVDSQDGRRPDSGRKINCIAGIRRVSDTVRLYGCPDRALVIVFTLPSAKNVIGHPIAVEKRLPFPIGQLIQQIQLNTCVRSKPDTLRSLL